MLQKTILIICDDEPLRNMLTECLEHTGHRLLLAHKALEGLELLSEHPADLVLADVHNTELNCTVTMKHMRRELKLIDTPLILLIDIVCYQPVGPCDEHSANSFIIKPFKQEELLERIASILHRYKPLKTSAPFIKGDVDTVSLFELLQTLGVAKRTCLVVLPDIPGSIYLDSGNVVHAIQGMFAGRRALQRILFLEQGRFEIYHVESPADLVRDPEEATSLLLEISTYIDETREIICRHLQDDSLVEKVSEEVGSLHQHIVDMLPLPAKKFLSMLEGDLKTNSEAFADALVTGKISCTAG